MNTYILTEEKEGISKHSGKQENYAIDLNSCYLLNLNMKVNMILIELMEFACIRHS